MFVLRKNKRKDLKSVRLRRENEKVVWMMLSISGQKKSRVQLDVLHPWLELWSERNSCLLGL